MESGKRELVFVLVSMAFMLLFAVGASVIFIRTYRREKRQNRDR
jgi:heme/copper-type cytochrome/quinol oxidase subunit 2